jgi:hypothetical protein
MEQELTLTLDDGPIRFTRDGKISVIDAIKMVTCSEHPEVLWGTLKEEHPEILDHCEERQFQEEGATQVADAQGWEIIGMFLFDHMVHEDLFMAK